MLVGENVLPYYRIDKTEDGKRFFFTHIGYFNFWNEYLILKTNMSMNETFHMVVNRTEKKFERKEITEEQKIAASIAFNTSLYYEKPEEMFKDFPELLCLIRFREDDIVEE